jgi:heat shock protein HtpX
MALVFAVGMNFFMYFASDKMVLRMYRAQIVEPASAPELYAMVDRLRQRAGLPMPTVAIAPHEQPNAFATGRNPEHAVVCVTAGIMRTLSREELEGVIAHELAHVRRRDVLVQTFVVLFAATLVELSRVGGFLSRALLFVLAPVAAAFVHLLLSAKRELQADALAAWAIDGNDLADALLRLDRAAELIEFSASPATEPLYAVDPFESEGIARMFKTHPPLEDRVRRLRELGASHNGRGALSIEKLAR